MPSGKADMSIEAMAQSLLRDSQESCARFQTTSDGQPTPLGRWEDLPPILKHSWRVAARATILQHERYPR